MSLLSFLKKVIWARAPEENPDVSETEVLLAALDLRLKDCERISWRNDKRITRAFGPIPIDSEVDKKVETQPAENEPAAVLPQEGEPTLNPLQIQQALQKGVD
ncbi:unnamed protein product [marine sediment metagenome]|uniref:Uncharacterized protein n=1 Tax=marine sediment metagenome TaxID=412755 RepID=X1LDX6_9ZZZZ